MSTHSHCSYWHIYISQKKSGFVMVILKTIFNSTYRPNLSLFWAGSSNLLYSIFFYFLQNLSNPLLFTHCCCYSKELAYLNCDLMQKLHFKYVNSLEQQQQCVKSSGFDKFCKKQKKNKCNRFEFSGQKVDQFGLQACLKFAFQINY